MEDKKFFNSITKDFLDVKPLLVEHKQAQKSMRKADRKLKTVIAKYSFMQDVVGINSNDTLLSNAIKLLLKSAGFEKVEHFESIRIRPKREDLRAWDGDDVFIIEVKGLNKVNPAYNDLIQVFKYFKENQKRLIDKKVYGLSIINHNNEVHVSKRKQTFKDAEREKDISHAEVGFMSTYDLLIAFWRLKTGKMTFGDFKNSFKKIGLITYDSKGGKTS